VVSCPQAHGGVVARLAVDLKRVQVEGRSHGTEAEARDVGVRCVTAQQVQTRWQRHGGRNPPRSGCPSGPSSDGRFWGRKYSQCHSGGNGLPFPTGCAGWSNVA
jgi:hypothetical protein